MSHNDQSRVLRLRQQAGTLLQQLLSERERLEAVLDEQGRFDPMKAVAGASSLDTAIASTRRIIADLEVVVRGAPGQQIDRSSRSGIKSPARPAAVPAAMGA